MAIWSAQRIIDTASRASRGDSKALSSLRSYTEQQAKNANKRIIRFEKAGETSPALEIALVSLNKLGQGRRFSRSKKLSISDLREEALALLKFNTAKTGSISGYRRYQKESLSRLEKQLGIKIPASKLKDVEVFLSSNIFNEFKEFDSERAIEDGISAILNDNANVELIPELWESYDRGELDLVETFENFIDYGNI